MNDGNVIDIACLEMVKFGKNIKSRPSKLAGISCDVAASLTISLAKNKREGNKLRAWPYNACRYY